MKRISRDVACRTGCCDPSCPCSPSRWQASSSVADAQPADRVYPVLQLTDSHVAEIDVTDGSVDDWEYIAGEPTLTPLDFAQTKGRSYDPADMDFRIWLGWHDATDRIFFAMERVDDIYINEFDRQDELLRIMVFHDTSVAFAVDGDHSGGERSPPGDPPRSIEESLQIATQAQIFHALGEVFDGGSRILLFPQAYHVSVDWFSNPPFAHGGGAVGGSPIVSVTEFYVTPFDRFLPLDSEDSDTSDLVAGKIIGFNIEIYDVDSGGGVWWPSPAGKPSSCWQPRRTTRRICFRCRQTITPTEF